MDERRSGEDRRLTEEELRRIPPIDLETLEAVLFGYAVSEEERDGDSPEEDQKSPPEKEDL